MRYETPNFDGETRRERNTRFGQPTPEAEPVVGGDYILSCFWEVSRYRDLSENGQQPLKPIDVLNWEQFTGNVLNRYERQIILDIDQAYLAALADERSNNIKQMEEQNKNK